MPNMAKKISVMPPEATLKRRSLEQAQVEHRVLAPSSSRQPNRARATSGEAEGAERLRARRPAVVRAFDDAVDEGAEADDREHRAGEVERAARSGSFDLGRRIAPTTSGDDDHRHVDEEDRAPPEVLEQEARRRSGRWRRRRRTMPAQMAMALGRSWAGKTLVRIDSVDGMTNAAAEAHDRPGAR